MNYDENLYFKQRDGTLYTKKTKEEIRSEIDPRDPDTFLPLLEEMNYPYFVQEWNRLVDKHLTGVGVIGRYIALMRLKGYAGYTWKDSTWYNAMANAKEYLIEKYRKEREKENEKMYKIIDKRGSGKTNRLMLLAKEKNGILACANPYAMREKANAYGLTGFDIASYSQLAKDDFNPDRKPVFIDELDTFLSCLGYNICGYTLTDED